MTPEQEKQYEKVFDKMVDDILNNDVLPNWVKAQFPTNGVCAFEIHEQSDQVTVIE